MSDVTRAPSVQWHDDVPAFRHAARDLLESDDVRHALHLAVLADVERGIWRRAHLTTVHRGEAVTLAAIRTPPHDLLLSACSDVASIDALADALHATQEGADVVGAVGPERVVTRFAEAWTHHTEVSTMAVRHGVYVLESIRDTRNGDGVVRSATPDDAQLLRTWFSEFTREVAGNDPDDVATLVDRWLDGSGRTLHLLDVQGNPACMTGVVHATPDIARITAVYTPPQQRGRGHATTLVSSVTRTVLRQGARHVTLYTDADNVTANALYRRIGYRQDGVDAHLTFVPER